MPLEAVLRGIDAAFEKWRARPARARFQMVNSVAYCAQAVAEEAQSLAAGAPAKREAPASVFDRRRAQDTCSEMPMHCARPGHGDLAESLERLNLEELYRDLEQLEQRLTAIEEKMIARARATASEEALFEARRSLDQELKPYRGKMSAEQLATLERQFLDRKVIEAAGLPRLSLFYHSISPAI